MLSPYFSGGEQLQLAAEDPTPHILAGLLTALGGVAPPAARHSPHHGRAVAAHLWSHGWSPYGPFAGAVRLSQVLVDHVARNAVLSR